MNAIGIDLGGTWIKGVLMQIETGEIVKQSYHPTHREEDRTDAQLGAVHWQQAVAEIVAQLQADSTSLVKAIGLSAPGLPNETNQYIEWMPGRLSGLEQFHWGDFLKQPVHVVNDAHAALLAESRFGVAKGHNNVVMLTLGTGVGGGVLIDGKLFQGNFQRAGSLGHITVGAETDRDITGQPGSLENAIGNATIEKRSMGRFTSTYQLLEAVKQGDYFAQWVWLSSVQRLAVGISSLLNAFSPEVVVLGGGITQAEDELLLPLAEFMSLYEWRPGSRATPIKLAQFGDMAGAIGAASFAIQNELKNTISRTVDSCFDVDYWVLPGSLLKTSLTSPNPCTLVKHDRSIHSKMPGYSRYGRGPAIPDSANGPLVCQYNSCRTYGPCVWVGTQPDYGGRDVAALRVISWFQPHC
ncbi:MAG: family transcriptional regulator [Spirosoma sp.]|nr:family transcriptional regulator [Spirosoma sp.]